jgi:heavy metal translocating P-type ATPase
MPHMTTASSPIPGILEGLRSEDKSSNAASTLHRRRHIVIAVVAATGIALYLVLRFAMPESKLVALPLAVALACGGIPLLSELAMNVARREFGSDLLAGISIIASVLLGEYLAGTLVVLMLSGGQSIEAYAVRGASAVLEALAKRIPSIAHRKRNGDVLDIPLGNVGVDDVLLVYPHETCPVDGVVLDGHGQMDESYLTGEPFRMSKAPGSEVLSGAINGDAVLTIRAGKLTVDSRYARIIAVTHACQRDTPKMRRLGDQLGAFYTPLAIVIAVGAWILSGRADQFLAVLVVATPCPLLIGIPVAVIGSISLSARRGIIIKKPIVLEQAATCETVIFDKTGTLTYGEPCLTEVHCSPDIVKNDLLSLAASLERYSKHPLARAVLAAADKAKLALREASEISEPPGEGLRGIIAGKSVQITSRKKMSLICDVDSKVLPPPTSGLECVVVIDGRYAATLIFRDEPRGDSNSFVRHLAPKHGVRKMMLLSGDRESEVKYLANCVGISEIYASKTPEQKLQIVRAETSHAKTLYLGDGINDAPALMAATVGVALGQNSDITLESAGAVIVDSSLRKVDEFLHIGMRMRQIALQSAVGGMALSIVGMALAATGHLPPVAGAICQEAIDVLAVLNALRAAMPPKEMSDF